MSSPPTEPSSLPTFFTEPAPQRWPLALRRRLTALGIVGTLMVALPLVQVLRFQNAAEKALLAARAGLDPVARVVEVERDLVAHRDLAGEVLRGEASREPERQRMQFAADAGLTNLAASLAAGAWERAIGESDALRLGWIDLVRAVSARRIQAADSDQAHRLLLEQCLQVIDFVDPSGTLQDATTGDAEARIEASRLVLARSLPRQLAMTSAQGAKSAGSEARHAARAAALAAQFRIFMQVQDQRRSAIETRLGELHRTRLALLAALLVLGVAAAALAAQLFRRLEALVPPVEPEPEGGPVPRARDIASRLLRRVSHGERRRAAEPARTTDDEAERSRPGPP